MPIRIDRRAAELRRTRDDVAGLTGLDFERRRIFRRGEPWALVCRRSIEGFDAPDLKEAKALLEERNGLSDAR